MNSTRRYAAYGAAFGTAFPLVSTLLDAWLRFRSWSPGVLARAQSDQPLHWVIDSAPLFLGIVASFAGRREDRLLEVNETLRHAESDLRTKNVSLVSAAKVKSQFLANMSHELRTPLNAIIGFSRILIRKLAGKIEPQQQENVRLVLQSGLQMLALVNDLLDLEKISAGTLHVQAGVVECGVLLEDIARTAKPIADGKGLGLEVTTTGAPLEIRTDGNRLRQIVVNLVNNAVNYSDKGTVCVECRPTTSPAGIEIVVRDEGIGIAKDQLGRIFDAFEQVDSTAERSRAGAGLGLAIVKQLTKLLGGSVQVASELGRGSTFTVTIPDGGIGASPRRDAQAHEPRGAGPVVLIVDDQETNLEIIGSEISEAG